MKMLKQVFLGMKRFIQIRSIPTPWDGLMEGFCRVMLGMKQYAKHDRNQITEGVFINILGTEQITKVIDNQGFSYYLVGEGSIIFIYLFYHE